MGWNNLTEPVLLMALEWLQVKDILSCSEVCSNWNRICQDQLLWKHLITTDFDIRKDQQLRSSQVELQFGPPSWKEEYIRLTDRFPCVRAQTLNKETKNISD